MKKFILVIPVIILLYGFYSKTVMEYTIKTILQKIDTNEDNVKNIIWSNCSGPGFYFPNPRDLKNAAGGDKVSIVKVVGEYVKNFTKSEDFKNRYLKYREDHKPQPPEKPQSVDSLKKQQKDNLTKTIEELEKQKKNATGDMKKYFEESIKTCKDMLAEVDNPDNPMYNKSMQDMMNQQYEESIKNYKQSLKQWETDYPLDSKWLVKKWLNEFLDKSEDVDFNAQIMERNKTKIFARQDYENKNETWKVCFRAGKEATVAARDFAKSWIAELK